MSRRTTVNDEWMTDSRPPFSTLFLTASGERLTQKPEFFYRPLSVEQLRGLHPIDGHCLGLVRNFHPW